MQESDVPVIEIKSVSNPQNVAAQTDRVKSFLFLYCKTYENKDLNKLSTFFTSDATENNRPFHELLPKYQKSMDMTESFNYRIEIDTYSQSTDSDDIRVKGKYFTRFLYDGSLTENSGNISMELIGNGDSYLIKRLDYASQTEAQWKPWVEVGEKK